MLELKEAQRRILEAVPVLPEETVSLWKAHERFLAEKITSSIDLPRFDNSAVDGYAMQSKDLSSAGKNSPVALRLLGKIPAGESFDQTIQPGQCVRIFTGSRLPTGADAVAMQEDTEIDAQNPARILFSDAVKPWENIRFRGEDVKAGAAVIQPGVRLTAAHLGLLGAMGAENISVGRQPKAGLLATGNELREAGQPLSENGIFESNRVTLAALATKMGAIPIIFPLVPDTLEATKTALKKAFSECDFVITSGGVSVGELDFVKEAFQQIGGKLDFWKIAMKPGKPFVFGRLREKFLFGLPGNPVSAFVTFLLLAVPALVKSQGAKNFSWPVSPGVLAGTMENRGDRPHFFRVKINPAGEVQSAGTQASHLLSSLASANGILELPPQSQWPVGEIVSVLRFD
ncbi:MAG: gephyrin-like molybdotransferase Glp [Verrucomicrobiota bacterium]